MLSIETSIVIGTECDTVTLWSISQHYFLVYMPYIVSVGNLLHKHIILPSIFEIHMKGIQCIKAGKAVVLFKSRQNKEQQHMLSENIKKFTVFLHTKYTWMEEAQKYAYTHNPKKFHTPQ